MSLKQAGYPVLLIEPVWNWNSGGYWGCENMKKLLIEPVWNWNIERFVLLEPYGPFNRTSMELKRRLGFGRQVSLACLLIEPVWNWNCCGCCQANRAAILLIEPVWNWNGIVGILETGWYLNKLLIEPVWNWNRTVNYWALNAARTFNRTSMELKQVL